MQNKLTSFRPRITVIVTKILLGFILATATVPLETFARLPRLLPEAFLLKPFALPELLALVRRMLGPAIGSRGQTGPAQNPRPKAIAIRWLEAGVESIPIQHRTADGGPGAGCGAWPRHQAFPGSEPKGRAEG